MGEVRAIGGQRTYLTHDELGERPERFRALVISLPVSPQLQAWLDAWLPRERNLVAAQEKPYFIAALRAGHYLGWFDQG